MPRVSQYNQRITDCEDKLRRLAVLFKIVDVIQLGWNFSILFLQKLVKIMVIVFIVLLAIFSQAIKLWINDRIVDILYIKPWLNKHDNPWSSDQNEQTGYLFYSYVRATEGYNYYYDMHSKCLQRTLSHNITNKFKQEINEYYGSDKYYNHYQTIHKQNMTALNNTIACKLNDFNTYLDFKQVCNIQRKTLNYNLDKRFKGFEDKKERTFEYLVCGEYQLQYEKMIATRNEIYENYSILRQEMCEEKQLIETKLSEIGKHIFHLEYSTLRYPCYRYMHCGAESDQVMHKIWMECYEPDYGKWLKDDISIDVSKFMFEFKGI